MAEGSVLRDLDVESLRCSVCLDTFKEPKVLPCCHTFCKVCLGRIISKQNKKNDLDSVDESDSLEKSDEVLFIICPICKGKYEIPEGCVENFITDYSLVQDSQYFSIKKSTSDSKSGLTCASCTIASGSSNDITILDYCGECEGYVCSNCVILHKKLAVYKQHVLLPLSQFSRDNFVTKKAHQSCNEHHETNQLYCEKCEKLICYICTVKSHQSHIEQIYPLDEADRRLQMRNGTLVENAKQTKFTLIRHRSYISRREQELISDTFPRHLKDEINCEFDSMIAALQKHRNQLLVKVDECADMDKKSIWAEKDHIETIVCRIESGLQFTDRALRCKNMAERILMNVQGYNLLREVADISWDPNTIQPPLVFRSVCIANIESMDVVPIHPSDITMTVEDDEKPYSRKKPIKVRVGEPIIVQIKFNCSIKDPKFQVLYGKSLKPLDVNDIVVYESESSVNITNVEFVPRCAGNHIIKVLVCGTTVFQDNISVTGRPKIGSIVKQGPDWSATAHSDSQLVGVVTAIPSNNQVTAQWNTCTTDLGEDVTTEVDGEGSVYQWGTDGRYEIEIGL